MIVEDELWLRRGLEQSLNWKQLNIELVKSAKNGKEALMRMEEFKPDIIITDIKMPVIDGFSMIHTIAEKNEKNPKFIIVSGYNDFDFAKKAIKHDVIDYILKPVDPDELKEAVSKAINSITQEKNLSQATLNIELKNLIYEKMFFYTKPVTSSEVFQEDFYFFLIISTAYEPVKNLSNSEFTFVSLPVGLYQLSIIGSHNEVKLHNYKEKSHQLFNQVIGISPIKSDIDKNFLAAYKEAEMSFQTTYYEESKSLKLPNTTLVLSRSDEENISNVLQRQNSIEVRQTIRTILDRYYDLDSKLLIQFQIFIFLTRFLNTNQLNLYNIKGIFNNYRLLQTPDDMDKLYNTTFEPLIENIINNFQPSKVNYVSLVMDYIEANYHDSSLSLEAVAEKLDLSPAYLSYIIKKDTNLNFIMHIKNKRIECAKELLVNSNLPVYEVSVKVGYNDVKYFIRVFKKETGHTPNRYREVFR